MMITTSHTVVRSVPEIMMAPMATRDQGAWPSASTSAVSMPESLLMSGARRTLLGVATSFCRREAFQVRLVHKVAQLPAGAFADDGAAHEASGSSDLDQPRGKVHMALLATDAWCHARWRCPTLRSCKQCECSGLSSRRRSSAATCRGNVARNPFGARLSVNDAVRPD